MLRTSPPQTHAVYAKPQPGARTYVTLPLAACNLACSMCACASSNLPSSVPVPVPVPISVPILFPSTLLSFSPSRLPIPPEIRKFIHIRNNNLFMHFQINRIFPVFRETATSSPWMSVDISEESSMLAPLFKLQASATSVLLLPLMRFPRTNQACSYEYWSTLNFTCGRNLHGQGCCRYTKFDCMSLAKREVGRVPND